MTCGLVHASYSLPEWQAVKLTFFAPAYYRIAACNSFFSKLELGNRGKTGNPVSLGIS